MKAIVKTMRTSDSRNRALAALLVTALFLMSSMIAMIPSTAFMAKAASPTLVLSPTSGTGELGDKGLADEQDATTVTVTGTGFDSEMDNIQLRIALSSKDITTTAGYELKFARWSIASSDSGKVKADAAGNWMATFDVPQLEAGTYNVFAVYDSPAVTSAPVVFTVNPGILVVEDSSESSTGVFNSKVHIMLSGFKGGETVHIMSSFLKTTPFGTTDLATFTLAEDPDYEGGDTAGLTTDVNVGYVSSTVGGTINIGVYGKKSSASASFTINPTVAVRMNAPMNVPLQGTDPQISIKSSLGSGEFMYVSGRNWIDDVDILANSIDIRVSGVDHNAYHSKVTTDSDGAFDNLKIQYFDTLPTQPASLIINGMAFDLASGNIIPPLTLQQAEMDEGKSVTGGLVVSDPSRPAVLQLTSTTITHQAGAAKTQVWIYAINGGAGAWGADWDTAGHALTLKGLTTTDSRGAGLVFITNIPNTAASEWAKEDHDVLPTDALSTAASATLAITPYVAKLGTRGYRETFAVSGYGFKAGQSLDVTIDGTSWFTVPASTVGDDGSFTSYTSDPLPKMPKGDHLATFAGTSSGNTYSKTITYKVVVLTDGTHEALTVNSVTAGDPVVLRSATAYGVFDLMASTSYVVKVSGQTVATFTSDENGAIPGSVSFIAPALSAGLYLVDIVDTTGASAIFPCKYSGDQYKSRLSSNYGGTVGDGSGLQLTIAIKLSVLPSVVSPGGQVTLSGAGLKASKTYYVSLSSSGSSLQGLYAGFELAHFTTDSSGAVPANVQVTIPDVSDPNEAGTTWYLQASSSSQLADLKSSGYGNVMLAASFTLTSTTGAAGDTISYAAKGLTYNEPYNIYFGFVDKDTPGLVVGSLVGDSYGKATGSFNVPSKPAGSYNVQLYDLTDKDYGIINIMPTFTITGAGGPGGPVGTGTFTPSALTLLNSGGSPVSSITKNVGFYTQITLTSNIGASLSVYVIAQIKDTSGNIVAMGLTAADVSGGAVKVVPVAFIGVANAGTYTVTIFVWSSIQNPTPYAPTSAFTFTAT